jgi:hypothetical protein
MNKIIRLKDLAPKIIGDIVNRRKPSRWSLADLRDIPILWTEKLVKF